MAFTAQELANIANAALDYYIKGPALSQTIQKNHFWTNLFRSRKHSLVVRIILSVTSKVLILQPRRATRMMIL